MSAVGNWVTTANESIGECSECRAVAVPRRDASHKSHASIEYAVKRPSAPSTASSLDSTLNIPPIRTCHKGRETSPGLEVAREIE